MPKNPEEKPVADEKTVDERTYDRDRRRPRSGPEGAMVVTALVELHRAGLHDGTPNGRYLAAARVIGDSLADEILGPEGATR